MRGPPALSRFRNRLSWEDLNPSGIRQLVDLAAAEDLIGHGLEHKPQIAGDRTTLAIQVKGEGKAAVIARESMVVCGIKAIPVVLDAFGATQVNFATEKADGDLAVEGECIGVLSGSASTLLTAERTLLNLLQKMSGIATSARKFVDMLEGYDTEMLDTRKNTLGWRALEKYSVAQGGFYNHRYGLNDRILIKDNHLGAKGIVDGHRLEETIKTVKASNQDLIVEVEVDHVTQVSPSINGGADAILLDNFSPNEVAKVVQVYKEEVVLEASGSITLETVCEYAEAGPHFLSTGAAVHRSNWVDLGLDWKEN